MKVALAARTVEPGETLPGTLGETLALIESSGGTGVAVQCDVAKAEDLERLIATTVDTFGRLDIVVNNAADMVPLTWVMSLSEQERRRRNDRVGYATTKAALNRLTNAAAIDLAADNIAVVAVDPGTTRTEVADLLGEHGLVNADEFAPMSVAVDAVLQVVAADDPMALSGQVIKAGP